MEIRAEHYFRASVERMRQARMIYGARGERGEGNYALVIYLAGLAVECLLRAFRWKKDPSFEGRHDLGVLFKASGMAASDEQRMVRRGFSPEVIEHESARLRAAVSDADVLWNNAFRFAPDARVRAYLKEMRRYKGVKGDVLKYWAGQLLNSAQVIVDRGVMLWNSGTR